MSRKKKRMKSWKQNPSEKKTQNQLENRVEKETKENQFNRAETIFLNSISHDIRTPLNVIIGYTALASAHVNEAQEVKKYLSKIETASNHLLLLINDVLDMSHIESGTLKLEHAPVYLPDVLENLKAIIQTDSSAKQLKFCADTKNMVHKNVITDKLRLKQVLLNILENAVKYTRPGGKIYFQIRELKEQEPGFAKYEFRVKDTGIGMSEEFIKEQLFKPFTQEKNDARTLYRGTGLGMSIVKALLDKMGGSIEVESQLGEGSTFTFRLPFKVDENAIETKKEEQSSGEQKLEGKQILLVEDNEINMEIAEFYLKELGIVVDKAWNGKEAIDKFEESAPGTYDLILMDIMMPVMGGREAARRIRTLERPDAETVRIYAMTAQVSSESVHKCLASGMNGHIAKPIDESKLREILTRCESVKKQKD